MGEHAAGLACVIEPLAGTVEVAWSGGVAVGRRVLVPAGMLHEVRTEARRVRFTYLAPEHVAVAAEGASVIGGAPVLPKPGPRVRRALAALVRDPDLGAAEVAAATDLSMGRLRALVRAELGAPLAMVRWWLRMRLVAQAVARGEDLTTAAHAGGFADSAHFSRTFRRMFGFPPSRLLEGGLAVTLDQ